MAVYKISELPPAQQQAIFSGESVQSWSVYSESDEKIGSVSDVLVDEQGQFRYLILDTGFWIFGKRVLLPVGRFRSSAQQRRIYLKDVSRSQVAALPEYHEGVVVDTQYEDRVQQIYQMAPLEASPPLEAAAALVGDRTPPPAPPTSQVAAAVPPAVPSRYEQQPDLYALVPEQHEAFKLYEERLVASKRRQKAGEVVVRKRVETRVARVAVPLLKERVLIQRHPGQQGQRVAAAANAFTPAEVLRIDLYEEAAIVHKQPFVRESVRIRKEVVQETLQAEEQIRREVLDVDTQGQAAVKAIDQLT